MRLANLPRSIRASRRLRNSHRPLNGQPDRAGVLFCRVRFNDAGSAQRIHSSSSAKPLTESDSDSRTPGGSHLAGPGTRQHGFRIESGFCRDRKPSPSHAFSAVPAAPIPGRGGVNLQTSGPAKCLCSALRTHPCEDSGTGWSIRSGNTGGRCNGHAFTWFPRQTLPIGPARQERRGHRMLAASIQKCGREASDSSVFDAANNSPPGGIRRHGWLRFRSSNLTSGCSRTGER